MVRDRGIYRIATELPARGSTVAQEVGNEQSWFESARRRRNRAGHPWRAIGLVLKCLPGSTNERLDATGVFDTIDLDAAADVDPERPHLPNRGANVLGVEPTREEDRVGGADLVREPPIGTRSGPASAAFCVAVDQDS